MWRLAIERRVRASLIEPFRKKHKLPSERLPAKRHEDHACAFVLQTQDESFNNCNTSVLANGAEAGCGGFAITPALKRVTLKLLALIADEIFRCSTYVVDGAFKKVLNR